jgi:hypothetical protein
LYNFVSLVKNVGVGEGSENGTETQKGKVKMPSISVMFQWLFPLFLGV